MMSKPVNRVFDFGPFRLDIAERLLLREGTPIPLTPKAFETLQTLVQNHGRLVTKDDLMKQVWPDVIVEEANLARNVWMLRQALGNGDGGWIETVPKLGYRFTAPVRELPPDADPPTASPAPSGEPPAPEHQPPPLAKRRAYFLTIPLAALTLATIGLTSGALARFWREPLRPDAPASAFLTDGSRDDSAAYWIDTGRIYFSRGVSSTRTETWTMDADGGNQRRANAEIPSLLAGRWSPDGKRVIFTKEGHPGTVWLADASGTNEVALPFVPGNMDWSPDGSRFVYQGKSAAGVSEIYLYTLDTGATVSLTPNVASADPSFSADGRQVAFTSWRDGNAEIYVMNADGSNVRRLTDHPAFDNYPVFSPDGTQIAFQSNREDEHFEVYLKNLADPTPPRRLTRSTGTTGVTPRCWSADGTQMLVYTMEHGRGRIRILNVEPFPAQLLLADQTADLMSPRQSSDGTRLLYEAYLPDRSVEIRVTHLATRRTERLFRTKRDYPFESRLIPVWSPDDSLIAFSAQADGNSEIFVMSANGSGLRNVTNSPLRDAAPVFSPDGREIVFARDGYGQAKLFRMATDGGNPRRVTASVGYENTPATSPDGRYLAFAADRESHGLDLFLLGLKTEEGEKLLASRRGHDTAPAFSPDGRRIVFIATSDGNSELYVMNVDGSGLFRLTRTAEEEGPPTFSRDGERIIFSSKRGNRYGIYQIDLR